MEDEEAPYTSKRQLATAPADLFACEIRVAHTPSILNSVASAAPPPTPLRIAGGGAAGLLVAMVLGMPLFPSATTPLAGVPLPVGALFTVGMVGLPLLRPHRLLQQSLRAFVSALLFAYGLPLLAAPFPPDWRFVFYLSMTSVVLALYEWSVPG
jgi:hypothetical protein